jgi:hypothetical protein
VPRICKLHAVEACWDAGARAAPATLASRVWVVCDKVTGFLGRGSISNPQCPIGARGGQLWGNPGNASIAGSPAPPGSPHESPACVLQGTAVRPGCRVLKIPEPEGAPGRIAADTGGHNTRLVLPAQQRLGLGLGLANPTQPNPLPNTGEGRISSGRASPLSVWLQVCSDGAPWPDEICRARGVLAGAVLAPQTHAAGAQSRQAWCAWSSGRGGRPIANFKCGITHASCGFQDGGTGRLASHQTRRTRVAVARSALRNTAGAER